MRVDGLRQAFHGGAKCGRVALSAWLLPFLAFLVGGLFAARVWGQWSARRRPHQLAWALGLTGYALASLVEAYVSARPWTVGLYRVYFPLAAVNVGLLGLGTILLARPDARTAPRTALLAALLGLCAIFALAAPFMEPLDPAEPVTIKLADGTTQTRPLAEWGPTLGAKAIPFPHPGRVAFLLLNVVGGLALVGGALLSWRATRRPGVLLIAIGALLPFLGGSLSTLLQQDLRIPLQLLGIILMFAGFLKGQDDARRHETLRVAT